MKQSAIAVFLLMTLLFGQGSRDSDVKAYSGQSSSTFAVSGKNNDEQTIRISNVTYEITSGAIPGLPPSERLVLRKSVRIKQVIGDMDEDGATTVEAWRFGVDFRQKPLYTVAVSGEHPTVVEGELLQVLRGLEEVPWWSLYKLGNGEHLFDTYVPPLKFSSSRDSRNLRYVGLAVAPDDGPDTHSKDPHAIAVLTYAAAEKVIRRALITADDPKKAGLLRSCLLQSLADSTRVVEAVEREHVVRSLRLTIRQEAPSALHAVTIPVAGDDLDTAHAQVPAGLRIAVLQPDAGRRSPKAPR